MVGFRVDVPIVGVTRRGDLLSLYEMDTNTHSHVEQPATRPCDEFERAGRKPASSQTDQTNRHMLYCVHLRIFTQSRAADSTSLAPPSERLPGSPDAFAVETLRPFNFDEAQHALVPRGGLLYIVASPRDVIQSLQLEWTGSRHLGCTAAAPTQVECAEWVADPARNRQDVQMPTKSRGIALCRIPQWCSSLHSQQTRLHCVMTLGLQTRTATRRSLSALDTAWPELSSCLLVWCRTIHAGAAMQHAEVSAAGAAPREVMDYDIAIVGCGPAGLSAAIRVKQRCLEANQDLSVCIVEKGAEVGELDSQQACMCGWLCSAQCSIKENDVLEPASRIAYLVGQRAGNSRSRRAAARLEGGHGFESHASNPRPILLLDTAAQRAAAHAATDAKQGQRQPNREPQAGALTFPP